ncbi:hypothetical protein AB3X52_04125 [Nocardioides sp. DS6]|uniref:Uncharacterized protein n=1 Tax=Nocardioides eburneus TaxID=3231482 RepID=A0ABV3SXP4_9ACTN
MAPMRYWLTVLNQHEDRHGLHLELHPAQTQPAPLSGEEAEAPQGAQTESATALGILRWTPSSF